MATMSRLKKWTNKQGLVNEISVILGIAWDDAQTLPEVCRFDACIIVAEDFTAEHGELQRGTLSGGTYAVLRIWHTPEEITAAWQALFPHSRQTRLTHHVPSSSDTACR